MITLYSYPGLYGVADNNGYGLKVWAFLRLAGIDFRHAHVVDTAEAPRRQLPYLDDDGTIVGDSDAIIAHLTGRYGIEVDAGLGVRERDLGLLVRRTLDDLYWVMSFSRWKDERYWPEFRDGFRAEHPEVTLDDLEKAREYNAKRYHFQGIGRYPPAEAYARGLADLEVMSRLLPETGFVSGDRPTSIDAAIYGFVANIWFYPIETPLKEFLRREPRLARHTEAIHTLVARPSAAR